MGYRFRTGLHACDVGGSLVFLDVVADRYFAIDGAARDACLRLVQGRRVTSSDAVVIDELRQSGLLQSAEGAATPQLCPTVRPVTSSPRDRLAKTPGLQIIGAALIRYAIAIVDLRFRPLHVVLGNVSRSKQMMIGRDTTVATDPAAFATAFAHLDRVITSLDRCLPRSIALASAMIANGFAPDLVLGVKLRPFEAHCWVQLGGLLVSDDLGTIAPFAPILIL